MKWILLAICIFMVSLSICNAATNVEVLSASFIRQTGKPVPETVIFQAIRGPGIVRVFNGGLENDTFEKVSSSIIKVNDTVVLSSSNFNKNVTQVQAVANLKNGENSLTVTLKGKPGGGVYIVIEIEADTIGEIEDTGGAVEVIDESSPIVGTKVEISPEAIPENAEPIVVGIIATEIPMAGSLPEKVHPAGLNINIESTVSQFTGDVYLTIPYNDINNDGTIDGTAFSENRVKVKHLIDGNWVEAIIHSRDPINNFIVVATKSFSNFLPYVSTENVALSETQIVANETIEINGDHSDWVGVHASLENLLDDTSCGDNNYILKLYTTMDEHNVYLLFETAEDISVGDYFEAFINYLPGEIFDDMPYADMGVGFYVGTGGLSPSFWNTNDYWDNGNNDLEIINHEFAFQNNIIELRISKSDLNGAEYFNPVKAVSWLNNGSWEICDEILFGPYINVRRISYRPYENEAPFYMFKPILWNSQGKLVEDDILSNVQLFSPSDYNTPLYETSNPVHWKGKYLYGGWTSRPAGFYFDEDFQKDIYYVVKFDEDPIILEAGNYKIRASDSNNYTYEGYVYYSGPTDIPYIPKGSILTFFDEEGNFNIYWKSPNIPTSDNHNGIVDIYGDNSSVDYDYSEIWATLQANHGMLIVDDETIQQLQLEPVNQWELKIGVNSPDRDTRTYSEKMIIDLTDTTENIPTDWQQPIMEDWAVTELDPMNMKWYPTYWSADGNVAGEEAIINTNDVTLATPGGDGNQAVDYISKYNLEGNFDIQVEFQTVDWPQDISTHGLCLKIGYGGSDRLFIGLQTFSPEDGGSTYYSSWLRKNNEWVEGSKVLMEEDTSNISGKLRIKRIDKIISTYYHVPTNPPDSVWVLLHEYSSENDIGPQPARVQVYSQDGLLGPYKATFSNFKRTN